ncbi:MAG: undecaprenyl-phosphate glucose phosphotransferase [Hyphomicrobiaceae bacterium]
MTDTTYHAPIAPAAAPGISLGDRLALISPGVLAGFVRLAELVTVALIGTLSFVLYVDEVGQHYLWQYMTAILAGSAATSIVLSAIGLYRPAVFTSLWRPLARLWLGWTVVVELLIATAFMLKMGAEFSRGWLLLWYVAGGAGLIASRAVLSIAVRHWHKAGRLQRRAVIVGGGEPAADLIAALEREPESDIEICGIFDDRGADRVGASAAGIPMLGNLDELIELSRRARIDLLIVSLPLYAESRLLQVFKKLWVLPVDIRLSAHTSKLHFRPRAYSYIGGLAFIDVADRPIADWDHVQKWLFDRVIGTLALVALAPVMALVALAIKLDSKGPVLFKQRRYGFNNELVEVWKFRSMYTDKTDANAAKLVTKGDPRVTRVGRFIRKSSLDELPQLFNVLAGTLSLVGPRPHALQAKAGDALYQDVVDGYYARHRVKPGLTGWAQINGWRGETDTAEKIQKRVEHDLYYIENWSVFLDLYILLATPFALLKADNAY